MILPVSLLLVAGLILYAGLNNMSITDVLRKSLGRQPQDHLGNLAGTSGGSLATGGSGVAGGGKGTIGGNLKVGRTDQGVDFSGSGPIPAVASGTVTRAASSGTGWPGGALIVWRLDQPISIGGVTAHYLYCAENLSVSCSVGQHLNRGDTIGNARGFFPYIEYGFAADANGTTLSAANGTRDQHPSHSNTPEGLAFAKYLGV